MTKTTFAFGFVILGLSVGFGQNCQPPQSDTLRQPASTAFLAARPDPNPGDRESNSPAVIPATAARNHPEDFGLGAKFRYYLGETYLNPSFLTAPAFRASLRMANPPGHFPTAYPADWRQGAAAWGRNYGDAVAQRVSFQTARFLTGALVREDPRYAPSSSRNVLVRSWHALGSTVIDRSDSGHRLPAFSNFAGAAAAGFAGNTYLPHGFADVTHAGQRATLQLGLVGAGNLYREFAPQMPRPLRIFLALIGR
jgi:hypothetical protein